MVSSASVTVIPASTTTAAPFSVYVGVEPDGVTIGASLTGVIVIPRVADADVAAPSSTTKRTIRPSVGSSLLVVNVIERSAV